MDIGPEKIALIAAAAVVVFWPQIKAALVQLKATPTASAPSSVASKPVGSSRSDWVADLLALQAVLDANGQAEASSLLGQAMVKIIGQTAAKK